MLSKVTIICYQEFYFIQTSSLEAEENADLLITTKSGPDYVIVKDGKKDQ